MLRRAVIAAALAIAGAAAPPASADELCAGVEHETCTRSFQTLAGALDAAAATPEPDRVHVGAGDHAAPAGGILSDGGTPVALVGTGDARLRPAEGTRVTLALDHPDSSVHGVAVEGPPASEDPAAAPVALRLAGIATDVDVAGDAATTAVVLLAGDGDDAARLVGGQVTGAVVAVAAVAATEPPAGTVRLQRTSVAAQATDAVSSLGVRLAIDDVDVVAEAPGGAAGTAALAARCTDRADAWLLARHVTVTGTASHAAVAECAGEAGRGAAVELRSSVLAGGDPFAAVGETLVETSYSLHADDPDADAAHARVAGQAETALDADRRPVAGSVVIDAGDPAPLAAGEEPFDDLAGAVRVTDGDGDGTVRRDAGAYEVQPRPVPVPAGNVLANPGAEEPAAAEAQAPAGWTRTAPDLAAMLAASYDGPPLPTAAAAGALGAGAAFFSAGEHRTAELLQRIDVAPSAASVDAGRATATVSGLLGGYGADEDRVTVEAAFRDPEGAVLGRLRIGPVAPGERGNATNLLHRSAGGPIPPRTRAVDVVVRGERVTSPGVTETYTDAYADNLALVLSVPGAPVPGPVDPHRPVVPGLRPFAGVLVLTARASISRRGKGHLLLACTSDTVGACRGTIEVRARLPRHRSATRIMRLRRFHVDPGRVRRVGLRMSGRARRALAHRRSVRATVQTIAHDGQAVERRRTVPLRLKLPRPKRLSTRRGARRR